MVDCGCSLENRLNYTEYRMRGLHIRNKIKTCTYVPTASVNTDVVELGGKQQEIRKINWRMLQLALDPRVNHLNHSFLA